jgi:hypothetical protein
VHVPNVSSPRLLQPVGEIKGFAVFDRLANGLLGPLPVVGFKQRTEEVVADRIAIGDAEQLAGGLRPLATMRIWLGTDPPVSGTLSALAEL